MCRWLDSRMRIIASNVEPFKFLTSVIKVHSHGAAAFFFNATVVTNGVIHMSVCDRICSCGATNRWVLNPICAAMIVSSYKSKTVTTALCEHFQQQCIKKSLTLSHRVNGPWQKVRHTAKTNNFFHRYQPFRVFVLYYFACDKFKPLTKGQWE